MNNYQSSIKKIVSSVIILNVILFLSLFSFNNSYAESRTTSITFKKGKIIELAYFSLKKGKAKQIFGEYLPKATPLVARYGGKPLGVMLKVIGMPQQGKLQPLVVPQMIGVFEWPSVKSINSFSRASDVKSINMIKKTHLKNQTFFTPSSLSLKNLKSNFKREIL